jgi:hypothetical protein
MGFIFSKVYEKFFTKKLEMCILGLESCGKTTFVDTLMGKPKKAIPTIGLNVKNVKKGSKSIIKRIRRKYENMGHRWSISIPAKLDRLRENGRCNSLYGR